MPQTHAPALPPLVSGALPLVGHAPQFLRDQLQLLERGYAEHGEIFRLHLRPGRRAAVFLIGPERAHWVFSHTDDQTLSIGPSLAFTRRLFGPDFYFLAEPDEYQHQRETLLPLFRARRAAEHLAIMDRHCAQFVARLGDRGTFDLPQEMNALVLGIIMESFLGADFVRHMPPTVAQDFRDFIRGVDPITPGWVPAPHLLRARRARDRLRRAVGELVQARREQPADPPDFLQGLISARALDGTPVTDQWVVQMALGVTFAGHDSTTGHLSWSVIDLLQHPDELSKVRAEQDRILPAGAALELSAVHRMGGLDRALRETSRLRPVAPVMLRRALVPIGIDGYTIPAGADVFVAPVLSHRLPGSFHEAASYQPDRYLADPKQASYLHGFGGGLHRCLGEHFARLLTHVAITHLLQHYDLSLADPDPAPVRTPAFKGPRSPCRIHYQPRARSALTLRLDRRYIQIMRSKAPALLPVFRSPLQADILAALLLHPEQEYSLTDLARRFDAPLSTVHGEVKRLTDAGLLRRRDLGRSAMVRANTGNRLVEPLTELLFLSWGPLQVIAEEFAGLDGAEQVLIFGSWAARYLQHPGPPPHDLDVLVIGHPARGDVYDAADRAQQRLGTPVNPVIRPVAAWQEAADPLVQQIQSDPFVVVLVPDEDDDQNAAQSATRRRGGA